MFSLNNKISIRQLQILLILDIFGTGVIILPRQVAEYGNQDGWIIVILGTIGAMLYGYIITTLISMFPNKNFVEYTTAIINKPIAIIIALLYCVKIIVNIAFELRLFGEIIKETMLPNTPFWIVCISTICLGGYAATKGYETRARIGEVLILLMVLPLLLVFFISSIDVDYTNILPVLKTPKKDLIMGAYITTFAFTGIDFCLLVSPYINNHKAIRKSVMQVVIILGFLYTLITIVTTARFGAVDLKRQMWPVIEMMDTIDIPGSFVERQGALIMSFWIISVFAIVNASLFFSSLLLKDVFKKGKHSTYILICIPIIFMVSYLPQNIMEVGKLLEFINTTFSIAYLFIIPLLLLVLAKVRKLGV